MCNFSAINEILERTPQAFVRAVLSKPCAQSEYLKIKVKPVHAARSIVFHAEQFTRTQAFQRNFSGAELAAFLREMTGKRFKNVQIETAGETFLFLTNKKGETTLLRKKRDFAAAEAFAAPVSPLKALGQNRAKNYIIPEGKSVPFLVHLGVMNNEGRVNPQKYDKFRQINRFLEYIDDILPEILAQGANAAGDGTQAPSGGTASGGAQTQGGGASHGAKPCGAGENHAQGGGTADGGTQTPCAGASCGAGAARRISVVDFGCGKSYLTFAVYYYLTQIKGLDARITGLDLKQDVIDLCNALAAQFGCGGLHFAVGDIADYQGGGSVDLVITLHACDTATDYALAYAVKHGAKAVLSVPCCQHELGSKLKAETAAPAFAALLRYGIVKERFAALATDAMRAELLAQNGYDVQLLEFIDMAHTPKNLLIRAVKAQGGGAKPQAGEYAALRQALNAAPALEGLL